jgi:hypothetical protein
LNDSDKIKTIKFFKRKEFKMSQLDEFFAATREVLGQGAINPNVEQQIRGKLEGNNQQAQNNKSGTIMDGAPREGVNASQKASFENSGGTGGNAGGGSFNAGGGGARSQVSAATNSGNTGSGGPGAGNVR